MILIIFSRAYLSSINSLWWEVSAHFLSVFKLELLLKLNLRVLYIRYWSFVRNVICQYFFQSFACLFVNSVFCRVNLLRFDEVPFFSFFSFMDHIFDVISKNSSPRPMSWRLSSRSSSERFVVLHFTFKSMSHFEFFFFFY